MEVVKHKKRKKGKKLSRFDDIEVREMGMNKFLPPHIYPHVPPHFQTVCKIGETASYFIYPPPLIKHLSIYLPLP